MDMVITLVVTVDLFGAILRVSCDINITCSCIRAIIYHPYNRTVTYLLNISISSETYSPISTP